MAEPLTYLNGEFIPASGLSVPIYDAGFVLGATVTEQLRTFAGRLFQLDLHLARLRRSLAIVEVEPPVSWESLADAATRLASENYKLLEAEDDLGLAIFVTPGPYAGLAEGRTSGPVVAMHTYRLPFQGWAGAYERGCALVSTPIKQVPGECWPPALKCRSRMHYYLADLAARKQDPEARAVLLDRQGRVTETATANVLAYRAGKGLISPRRETILQGISLTYVRELAGKLGIHFTERDLSLADLALADEVLLTSTPSCILPVTRVNWHTIGEGWPGEIYCELLDAWSESVGVDIRGQARRGHRECA